MQGDGLMENRDAWVAEALAAVESAQSVADLEQVRVSWLQPALKLMSSRSAFKVLLVSAVMHWRRKPLPSA